MFDCFLSQTFPANPSTWPRPLCGPCPWPRSGQEPETELLQSLARSGGGDICHDMSRCHDVTRLATDCHEPLHSDAVTLEIYHQICCHPFQISSSCEARAFTFVNFIHQFLFICHLRKLLYCCYFCPIGSYFDIFFWFLRYSVIQ